MIFAIPHRLLVQEQDHQIDLATTLGEKVLDLSGGPKSRRTFRKDSLICPSCTFAARDERQALDHGFEIASQSKKR